MNMSCKLSLTIQNSQNNCHERLRKDNEKKRTVKLKRIVIIYGSFISELYSFILISLCGENIQMIVVMHVYIVYSN